ncbi:MAG TPA: adenylate kinase [Anaerolineales bacterium]|nr:adenylate kinase [Anaerolineales bacterium]
MATFYVLLGPPGAGKGTQAQIVSKTLGLPHISSGDIFRENLKNQTELGQKAKGFMDRGELVPDDLTISMVRDRLTKSDCAEGALLDGFPRTAAQAEELDKILAAIGSEIKAVPYIKVESQVLVERLSGRWTCKAQGHVFHEKYNPPKQAGVCDFDGSELYQREDDKAETVKNRIQVYFKQTLPLIEYYRKAGTLVEIDGDQVIEKVTQEILRALDSEELE